MDIIPKNCYFMSAIHVIAKSLRNINPNLPEVAMIERHPKVLKLKPPRYLYVLLEALVFGR
jgi:hypothetical protein